MSRTVAARYAGTCALCDRRWAKGESIAAFDDTSDHVGHWGHPACVAVDAMGHASVDDAREHIGRARQRLAATRKPPMGQPPVTTRGAVR